jgi:hypothetical protein
MTDNTINSRSEKASGLQSEGPKKLTINKRKSNAKSTATEAQYERINRMYDTELKEISTVDFRRAGIMAPAARIKEMNDNLGYYIPTIALRDIYDEEGFLHRRVAVYQLIDRPLAKEEVK